MEYTRFQKVRNNEITNKKYPLGRSTAIESLQNKKSVLNPKANNIYCGTCGCNHIEL